MKGQWETMREMKKDTEIKKKKKKQIEPILTVTSLWSDCVISDTFGVCVYQVY